ncbi:GDP-mannose 4,6-dehydratase [Lysobacter enzymogenes]|uniref:GDP-mannose 4,6-dehydratase n=1 Tax=Lysobacter enzymogenes TaxID=69 RepID=UPI00089AE990|nr:GDP-mannose 4,6-dehydratase [Lysobacter enzymogenes]SDW23200.1 GDP-4-dehydro-6-deoxy-D-mannose reductase [Lysobacter enzymogenes]
MSQGGVSGRPARLLATGASGFVGGHLRQAIERGEFGAVELLPGPRGLDVRDAQAVDAMVEQARPDLVIHLAAQSFVPRSFAEPVETFEVNVLGTLNLLRSLSRNGFAGRMVYVSSGDVYGKVAEAAMPVNEDIWPAPRNPYAASKVAAEQLCLQWNRSEGLDVVVARPFNHIGPGQARDFVIPSLAHQVARIRAGLAPPQVHAGDIDVTRDFTDVRDIVRAYGDLLRAAQPGQTYVVGSGEERSIRELLEAMAKLAGVQVEVVQDPAKLRPSEQRRMRADPSKLTRDTGWRPRIGIDTTLNDILQEAGNSL